MFFHSNFLYIFPQKDKFVWCLMQRAFPFLLLGLTWERNKVLILCLETPFQDTNVRIQWEWLSRLFECNEWSLREQLLVNIRVCLQVKRNKKPQWKNMKRLELGRKWVWQMLEEMINICQGKKWSELWVGLPCLLKEKFDWYHWTGSGYNNCRTWYDCFIVFYYCIIVL